MKLIIIPALSAIMLFFLASCSQTSPESTERITHSEMNSSEEKQAIIETLNNETKAAFQRDYEGWKVKWVQEPYVYKAYMNFAENSFSEDIGWQKIDDFVRTYIEEHPEPDPLPTPIDDIDVRLYGNGAWVTYLQNDAVRGLKRETRLMEKVDDQWKIAGMQTTIYGFKGEE